MTTMPLAPPLGSDGPNVWSRDAPMRRALEDLVSGLVPNGALLPPAALGKVTSVLALHRQLWEPFVLDAGSCPGGDRWNVKLYENVFFDVWLLAWQPNHATDWHDHGGSAGSFAVASGTLREQFRRLGTRRLSRRELEAGAYASFGPAHVHDVRHHGDGPAFSIHAYSPPLVAMTYYDLGPFGLMARETVGVDSPEGERTVSPTRPGPKVSRRLGRPAPWSVGDLLDEARDTLDRVSPEAAFAEIAAGAALVDIRPPEQRALEGEVPGAFVIGRNVLEWRLDPRSDASIPELARYDQRIIVMCSEGYASSLAAVTLRRIGLSLATDLDGGFQAWKAAGLPTREPV